MRRPDLTESFYGGWQVIDATPQEVSDYKMQCGPASVEAVRRGDLGWVSSTPFGLSFHHLQMTSSEGFQHHIKSCLFWFLHEQAFTLISFAGLKSN